MTVTGDSLTEGKRRQVNPEEEEGRLSTRGVIGCRVEGLTLLGTW